MAHFICVYKSCNQNYEGGANEPSTDPSNPDEPPTDPTTDNYEQEMPKPDDTCKALFISIFFSLLYACYFIILLKANCPVKCQNGGYQNSDCECKWL